VLDREQRQQRQVGQQRGHDRHVAAESIDFGTQRLPMKRWHTGTWRRRRRNRRRHRRRSTDGSWRLVPSRLLICVLVYWIGRIRPACPDIGVSDDALVTCVQELRKALGDDCQAAALIETRHRSGYLFVAKVWQSAEERPAIPQVVARFECNHR